MSIKIENIETYGWEAAARGMRNPKNSWDMSDSEFADCCHNEEHQDNCPSCFYFDGFNRPCKPHIGENDLKLMHTLAKAGSDHGKFLRMITVTMDITAPLYWWKEFDTYKVGNKVNPVVGVLLSDAVRTNLLQKGSSCFVLFTVPSEEVLADEFEQVCIVSDKDSVTSRLEVVLNNFCGSIFAVASSSAAQNEMCHISPPSKFSQSKAEP